MLDTTGIVRRWRLEPDDHEALVGAVAACRKEVERCLADADFRAPPVMGGRSACEPSALAPLLDRPEDRSDVRVTPGLTDVVLLHTGGLPNCLDAPSVVRLRAGVDRHFAATLGSMGLLREGAALAVSGHLWYPEGSHMGWHTNTRVPGWRMYLTAVDSPERSFFRWRDPDTGSIDTSVDTGLDVRVFRPGSEAPLWHCVWAGVARHSFGYRVVPG